MDPIDGEPQFGEKPLLNTNSRPYITPLDAKAATSAPNSTQTIFQGSGVQHSGQGPLIVGGNVNITSNAQPDSKEAVEKCIKALFLTDPSEDRDMLKRKKGKRAGGTCEWILNTKELNDWLRLEETEQKSRPNGILWLHGNPGTGKSTMAIYLAEELSTAFDAMENMTLAYFFCDASFEKRNTATSIIRGLLYQLVQRHRNLLSNYILPKYKERGDQLFTSFDYLWTIFIAAAADQETGNTTPNLSILITSRPYPEINEYLQDFMNADLASFDEARQDINRCITERVDDLAKKKHYTDKVKREITDLLRDKTEGTFLWVGLACEELRRKPSKDAIPFLRGIPKGLTSIYKSLLETAIESETGERMAIQRILSFVAISFRALSVLELSEACQLHQDEPDLDTRLQYIRDQIASCRLLVVVYDENVQLLHQSVRDFLTGSGSGFFIERIEAHADAASCCIDNLIKRFHSGNTSSTHFLYYAMVYWPEHAFQYWWNMLWGYVKSIQP
ncbi:NACHT domain-containing protein [Trichoderma breve]|uniref:NACHT domain-containing protein n=1 Tax=Trichoderma breve TaxID=2034170 RepID=A0A9W9BB24_9HYPO|nr:NACHT domain-containing protein [Trichoderma breve]KAJ4859988.1 NACHT domain-containing protein [Trichoderma breve]